MDTAAVVRQMEQWHDVTQSQWCLVRHHKVDGRMSYLTLHRSYDSIYIHGPLKLLDGFLAESAGLVSKTIAKDTYVSGTRRIYM